MVELGTRYAIERVYVGNSPPKAARACALLDGAQGCGGAVKRIYQNQRLEIGYAGEQESLGEKQGIADSV
jgi:hypothetical protein